MVATKIAPMWLFNSTQRNVRCAQNYIQNMKEKLTKFDIYRSENWSEML